MKSFNLFLLVGLLIWFTYSHIAFGIVGPFTASAFTCLQSSVPGSFQYVVVRAYQNSHSPAGIDPNALQTMQNAYAAGYSNDVYIEICRGINATSQINLVNTDIINRLKSNSQDNFRGLFYIKVKSSIHPDCSWESYGHSDNCNFLKEAANAVQNIGWSPVIFSTSLIWKQFFGSSCDTFASDSNAWLEYANYDATGHVSSTQSFADFVPFGGWTVAS